MRVHSPRSIGQSNGEAQGHKLAEYYKVALDAQWARKPYKHESDFPSRSMIEAMMFPFKTLFYEKLFSRYEASHLQEAAITVSILNKFTRLGRVCLLSGIGIIPFGAGHFSPSFFM